MVVDRPKRVVVGVTGASGAPYARRLLTVLRDGAAPAHEGTRRRVEVGCVFSDNARSVWQLECGGSPDDLGLPIWGSRDFRAPFASGSAQWDAMVIVPCSMGVVGRLAHGTSDSLMTRAADVMMKERRTLLLVPRETPMSALHLENLATLARLGAIVLPACPSFYGQPQSVHDVVDTVVARVLDHLDIGHELAVRWGSPGATA